MTSLSWFVARRYLTARRKQALISLISAVSVIGVGVGVMALIIALALMTGVQTDLRDRIVGSTAHVTVTKVGGAFGDVAAERKRLNLPGVIGSAPAIYGYGLLQSTREEVAVLKGIDPALEPTVTRFRESMVSGTIDALSNRPEGAKDGIIICADLARALGVDLGDQVFLTTTNLVSTPLGLKPHGRYLQVVGTVRFGYYEIDTKFAFVSLTTAAEMLGRDGPEMIQLRLEDMEQAPAVRQRLQLELGPDYQISDWQRDNGNLYSALWLEKVAISLTIGLIVMVAALNIVGSLVLLVMEKNRDIAILRTMGASARVIRRIFVYQGLAIGLLGTCTGTVLGVTAAFVLDHYELIKLPGEVYQITHLPFRVEPWDVAIVVLSAVAICLAATVYPARQAGRIDPAEALRNQ